MFMSAILIAVAKHLQPSQKSVKKNLLHFYSITDRTVLKTGHGNWREEDEIINSFDTLRKSFKKQKVILDGEVIIFYSSSELLRTR